MHATQSSEVNCFVGGAVVRTMRCRFYSELDRAHYCLGDANSANMQYGKPILHVEFFVVKHMLWRRRIWAFARPFPGAGGVDLSAESKQNEPPGVSEAT